MLYLGIIFIFIPGAILGCFIILAFPLAIIGGILKALEPPKPSDEFIIDIPTSDVMNKIQDFKPKAMCKEKNVMERIKFNLKLPNKFNISEPSEKFN